MQQHVEQIFPKCFRWHHKKVSLVAFAQHVSVISNHLISSWMMNYITGSPALISVVIPLRVRLLSPRGKGFIVKWWHKSPHLSALLLLKYCFMGSFFLFDFYSYLLSCVFIIFFPGCWMAQNPLGFINADEEAGTSTACKSVAELLVWRLPADIRLFF